MASSSRELSLIPAVMATCSWSSSDPKTDRSTVEAPQGGRRRSRPGGETVPDGLVAGLSSVDGSPFQVQVLESGSDAPVPPTPHRQGPTERAFVMLP